MRLVDYKQLMKITLHLHHEKTYRSVKLKLRSLYEGLVSNLSHEIALCQ